MRFTIKNVTAVASAVAALLVAGASTAFANGINPVSILFDTTQLTYSTDPQYVTLYNGGASQLTGSNIYVSFQGGSGFSANVVSAGTSATLSYNSTSGTWTYTTTSGSTSYGSIMSQGFAVGDLSSLQLVSADAARVIFSYGVNAYGYAGASMSPPGTPLAPGSARYSVIEVNYNSGGGNGVDLTNIDQFGGALSMTARNAGAAVTNSTGNTLSSQEMMTRMVGVAGGTASTLVVKSGASQVASVTGVVFAGTSNQYGDLQNYLGTVWNGSGSSTLKSPSITNVLDETYPGGLGAFGFTTGSSPSGLSANTNYNCGYYFTPTITSSGSSYGVTFSGSVTVTSGTTTGPVLKTYPGLTINVLTGSDGSAMNSYLNSGGPTSATNIQLTGTGWSGFNQDFYLPGNGGSAAPDMTLVNTGSTSAINTPYGQVVQKVIGDFQVAVVTGLYGNTMSGSYVYYQNNLTTPVSGSTAQVGTLSSALWFQNPSLAYSNTNSLAKNLYANEVFPNSFVTGTGGFSASSGGVYGAPFDDRFSSVKWEPQFTNTFVLPTDGGSLTVKFLEGAAVVPEPSAVALVAAAGATLGGIEWRRRRRRRAAVA